MDNTDDDLAFAAPSALPFQDGELRLQVAPADMGQILAMTKALRPVAGELMALPRDMVQRLLDQAPTPEDMAWLFELLVDRGPIAVELVAIATRQPQACVLALLPDRFAHLFVLVYEVNVDFFGRAARMLQAAGARLVRATAEAEARLGPKPSTS